jgi:hypothetical protein
VNESSDDLSFYDICVRYIASLHDFHDEFILPSEYEAVLPITVDIYDGRVLIDGIDRTVLDPQTFPFAVGDELISVDGTSAPDWITALGPYAVNGQGNPVSRNRLAAAVILDRYQGWYTYANKVKPGRYGDCGDQEPEQQGRNLHHGVGNHRRSAQSRRPGAEPERYVGPRQPLAGGRVCPTLAARAHQSCQQPVGRMDGCTHAPQGAVWAELPSV